MNQEQKEAIPKKSFLHISANQKLDLEDEETQDNLEDEIEDYIKPTSTQGRMQHWLHLFYRYVWYGVIVFLVIAIVLVLWQIWFALFPIQPQNTKFRAKKMKE